MFSDLQTSEAFKDFRDIISDSSDEELQKALDISLLEMSLKDRNEEVGEPSSAVLARTGNEHIDNIIDQLLQLNVDEALKDGFNDPPVDGAAETVPVAAISENDIEGDET